MSRISYERNMRSEDSVIDRDDYLVIAKRVSLKDRILLSPIMKYVVPTLIAVACLMTTVYLIMYFVLNNADDMWPSTCNIRASYRIDCFPGRLNISYNECNEADCCWHDQNKMCFHSVPSRHGYTQKSNFDSYQENEVLVPRRSTSPFGSQNIDSLTLNLRKHSDPNHIEIVLNIGQRETREKRNVNERRGNFPSAFTNEGISGRATSRDDPTEELLDFLPNNVARGTVNIQTDPESLMDVYVYLPEFSVTVTRKNDTSHSLLSTARGPLILTKNFWEFTLYITNSTLYGLNQLELNGTTNWIYDNENGTSRLGFLGINDNGEGTSCYVSHDGPMEITVINESNLIVLRGISLPSEISIHVFAGPTPLSATEQLTKALRDHDDKIDDLELSSLGLHVCPNDDSSNFIESMRTFIEAMEKNEAPWDSHCIHQDFDPTLGNSMSDTKIHVVEEAIELLGKGMENRTVVPHLSPMLFADNNTLSLKLASVSLLLTNSSGLYRGSYRKQSVFYPDWHDTKTHSASLSYLNDYMKNFGNSKLIYLRDSWPRDKTNGHSVPDYTKFDYVPRILQSLMANGTVPFDLSSLRHKSHYTEHSSYSWNFRNFARDRGNSTSVVIRGLWGESGNSSWSALRAAIRAGVGSGIVGQLPSPMYACGTGTKLGPGDHNDELCSRWYGASVAWPHVLALPSNLPEGDHLTTSASLYVTKHLRLRGSLITYANTILAQYQTEGSPILAPTSLHYPKDLNARNRWNQFMWGYGLLVGLVTLPKVSQVSMWIPGKYPWRHLNDGTNVYPTVTGITSITAVESQIVTLIRPGCIIPIHEKISMTSVSTIKNDLTLVINLACDNLDCNGNGKIFYGSVANQGEYLNISANQTTLKVSHILRVQAKACSNDGTQIQSQGTLIKNVVIYGYGRYDIDMNFCNFTEDSFEKNFS